MVLATATKIAGKTLVKGIQKHLGELFKVQRSLSPQQMRKSLADAGMDLSEKVKPATQTAALKQHTSKSELIPRIYWHGGKYSVHYLPPNTQKLIVAGEKVKIDKYFSDLIEEKTKFYNEGEKFKNYLTGDLKPFSSAKELAKEELTYIPVRGERAAKEVFPGIIEDLGSGYYSTYSSGLKDQVIRSRSRILGGKMKPLSYLDNKSAGQISFSAEQRRRMAHKNLEDFLRKSEKNKRYDSMQLAEMEEFKGVVPEGSDQRFIAETIRKFRDLKKLEKTVDPSKLNPFELSRARAGQFHKTDPQLQGLWNLGREITPPRGQEGKLTGILSSLKKRKNWKTGEWTDQTASEYYRGMLDRDIIGSKKLARLHDRGFMHNPGSPPGSISTPLRNNVHTKAETRLRFLDDMIEQNPGDVRIKAWKKNMDEIGEDMKLLGLQSDINGVIYGKWYAKPGDSIYRQLAPFFRSLKKEHPLKRLKITGPSGKKEMYKYSGYDEGGIVNGYQAGGLVGLGSKILARLAKKLSEKELKMLMGSLWKGVDPKKSGRYRAWDKQRWGPGYKWPYKKSRIRGPEMKKSHYASLSDEAKERLRERYAKRLAEYIARKKGQ